MKNTIASLRTISKIARINILNSVNLVGTGHIGTSFSSIEILVSLYFEIMNIDPHNPNWSERDRFILSKGHGAPGLYSVLAERGFFCSSEMSTLRQLGSRLQGHPCKHFLDCIDVSTGSLGQGLSIGLGMALALRLKGAERQRVFCILGDGEIQEGQNWEAFMAASSLNVTNLVAIVDRNFLQNDKSTEEIIEIEDLEKKISSFNWDVVRIDGHDFKSIISSLQNSINRNKPLCVIADTIKGKGVSFMENVVKWHHHPITDEELKSAILELNG